MAFKSLRRLHLGGIGIALLLLLMLFSLHLMSNAVQNSTQMSRYYIHLLVVNGVGMFILLSLISYKMARLMSQYVRNQAGSRLTVRMVFIFIMLSLAPVGVVYYYSYAFLQGGIDSWFDVEIDQAMEDARNLGQASLDLNQRLLLKYVKQLFQGLDDTSETALSLTIAELRQQSGALELSLTDMNGQIFGYSSAVTTELTPSKPEDFILQQLRNGQSYVGLFSDKDELMIRVAIPDYLGRSYALLGTFPTSERINGLSNRLEDAYNHYKELAYLRQSLKRNFTLTLFMVMLFGVLSAIWMAIFSAQRMVAPITNIADGTRAVAEGNYDRQLPIPKRGDELAFLVASFNAMTRRIAHARDQADSSQREVEGQRAYLETVLDRLSSGVMTFDATRRLRTSNPAAEKILGIQLRDLANPNLNALAGMSPVMEQFAETLAEVLNEKTQEWRGELNLQGQGAHKVLICRATPFAQPNGRLGHIVLFDDVTALISAQRDAAWGEVARRLAHEIKNPLTPIKLSAERLRRKYLTAMPEPDAEVMDKATHTIIQQVEAMRRMVNDFSEYAKPPKLEIKSLEADRLIDEIVDLYRGAEQPCKVSADLAAKGMHIEADALRIRQMVHNLVKNAQEAIADKPKGKVWIRSSRITLDEKGLYELRIEDNGPGFDEAMMQNLFEPYVTNKSKGTGLGLPIVKKIVEEHGGNIWAENSGSGAVMVVQLPISNRVEEKTT